MVYFNPKIELMLCFKGLHVHGGLKQFPSLLESLHISAILPRKELSLHDRETCVIPSVSRFQEMTRFHRLPSLKFLGGPGPRVLILLLSLSVLKQRSRV